MKLAATLLTLLALALITFGYWGSRSQAGQRAFDEMAGIIPWFAWYAGLALGAVAVLLWIWNAVQS